METETLEKKIARLPDELKFKVEGYIDGLLMINADSENVEDVKPANTDIKIKRGFGGLKGFITYMSDDFDEPLEDFKDYM